MKRRSFFAGIAALATGAIAAPALVSASEAKAKFPTGGGFTAAELTAIEDTWLERSRSRFAGYGSHAHALIESELSQHNHTIALPVWP